MKQFNQYVDPVTNEKIEYKTQPIEGYYCENELRYKVHGNLADFVYPKVLPQSDQESLDWYKDNAAVYDDFLPLTFNTFGVDEKQERLKLVNALNLNPQDKVLEIGCGTGRDTELIAEQLGEGSELHIQDISREILEIAYKKFENNKFPSELYMNLSNGYYLPYSDNYFDKTFHFGGLNTFGDIQRAISEMVRVTKPGGKIVIGDENMPVWLRETEFGKVLMNSNPHYKFNLPLEFLPVEARNVKIEWIIGGVFYMISFDIGEGEPTAEIDFLIPGARGGTHRTRYYGALEGVDEESKTLAYKARAISNKSMYDWLREAIKEKAKKDGVL